MYRIRLPLPEMSEFERTPERDLQRSKAAALKA